MKVCVWLKPRKPRCPRITLVTHGDLVVIEQIQKQLNKLINVIKVVDFADTAFVQRDLATHQGNGQKRTIGLKS